MISLKSIIVEGRYDSIVTQLSREMLSIVKDSYSAVNSSNGMYNGVKIFFKRNEPAPDPDSGQFQEIFFTDVENADIPLEFKLALRVQWREGFDDYVRGGDAYIDQADDPADADTEPYIEIRFVLDPADVPRIYSSVAMDLRDTLRHEIEHITQTGWNLKPGKFIASDQDIRRKIQSGNLPAREYFMLPMEIPAMIQGLYMKAKKSKKPFKQIVNQYLENFFYMRDADGNAYLTPDDRDIILAKWREHLPKLGLRVEL